MPGIFDPQQSSGILSGLANLLASAQRGASGPAGQEMGFRQGAYNELQQQGDPNAALLMASPQAYQMNIGQRNLMATIQALQGLPGPDGKPLGQAKATYFAIHPEEFSKLTSPMKLDIGETPWAPMNPFGIGGGQAIQGQPSQMPAGPGDLSTIGPGAQPQQAQGIPGQLAPANSTGIISPETARRSAEQWVLGDKDALANAGFSKLGQMGRMMVQNQITQVMNQEGLTNADVMQRQTRFPAVKKAVDKLYGAQASMGQAGIEFQKLFPQFMGDLQKYGATQYPDANKFFQFIDSHRGDPNVAPLAQRMITLSNVYGRAVSQNPQSANTDYKHREFAQALNQFWPMAASQRIGDAMNQEIQTAHDSVGKEVNRLFVDNGLGRKPDTQTLTDAKSALAKGHPRSDVMQRLSEHGFTGDGL